jgi:hypothetical protein
MISKKAFQLITFIFIFLLITSLIFTYWQNNRLKEINNIIEIQRDSLQLSHHNLIEINEKLFNKNEELDKVNNFYLELFKSSDSLFNKVSRTNTPEAYYKYVKETGAKNYADPRILQEITTKLSSLMNKSGYVQIMNSDGTYNFEEKEKLFEGYQFYEAKSDWTVRKGIIGNPDYTNTSRIDVLRAGKLVNVLRIIGSGNAAWAEISYHSN